MRKSKKRFGLISCMLLLLMGFVSPALVAAENLDWDDTTVHGDYLGKNEVREFSTSYVYVIGRKLLMHESSDLSSAPVQVLEEGDFIELLESQHGVLYVRDAVGSSNGDVTCIDGWVDELCCDKQSVLCCNASHAYHDCTKRGFDQ